MRTPCDFPDENGMYNCPYEDYCGYESERCRVCCGLGVDEDSYPDEDEYLDYDEEYDVDSEYDETEYTHWVGVRLLNKKAMSSLTEHLAMNGYTFDTNGEDTIFIYDDEFDYLLTILDDRNLKYEVL